MASTGLAGELRRALYHLYDPAGLRRSPLVATFGLGEAQDPAPALRRVLTEAIDSLKPGPDVPPQANSWRIYHVLFQRFSEQFTQREVATDLGLSIRQLRRLEAVALRELAGCLAARQNSGAPSPAGVATPADEDTPSREQELEWLRRSLPSEPVDLDQLCQALLRTVAPVAEALGVRLEASLPAGLPRLSVQLATVRQALLNVLTTAIRCTPGGTVLLQATAGRLQVQLEVRAGRPLASPVPIEYHESLEMARQLVELSGGSLEVAPAEAGQPLGIRLGLPAAGQIPVLVVDDNADTLQLLERYLAGSRYHFVSAPDPQQALSLAEQTAPGIIVLDVMLPEVDGWELLGRLREHPRLRGVPILVCTILPQEALALGLGAAAFIRKPVSRRAFLAALDRQVEQLSTGSG